MQVVLVLQFCSVVLGVVAQGVAQKPAWEAQNEKVGHAFIKSRIMIIDNHWLFNCFIKLCYICKNGLEIASY